MVAGLAVALVPVVVSIRLWPLWVLYGAGTALALAVDAALAPRPGDVRWELELPPSMGIGEAHDAVLRVALARQPGPAGAGRPVTVVLAVLDVGGPLAPVSVVSGELRATGRDAGQGAGARGVLTFPLVAERRGTGRIEAVWLRVPGPLGLIEHTVRAETDRTVAVHPSLGRVRRAAIRFADRRTYLAGLKIERYVGDGTDFEALREFMPGHDSRSIDWKATARHRRLLCREFRAERDHQVVLAFDTGRLMAEPVARRRLPDGPDGPDRVAGAGERPIPRLDHAIHTGLVLAYVALRSGDRVGLYAFDERPRRFAAPQAGSRWFPGLLDLTAGLDYTDAETNFTLGLTELAGRLHRRSLVVVMTDFVDSITAELMADNLSRLSRRHLVLFVALRDPLLDTLVTARPDSLLDVQRAVVAADLERDRERVLARLRRVGVFALDLPPARVEPRVIERYLEIKRKEMIA